MQPLIDTCSTQNSEQVSLQVKNLSAIVRNLGFEISIFQDKTAFGQIAGLFYNTILCKKSDFYNNLRFHNHLI